MPVNTSLYCEKSIDVLSRSVFRHLKGILQAVQHKWSLFNELVKNLKQRQHLTMLQQFEVSYQSSEVCGTEYHP